MRYPEGHIVHTFDKPIIFQEGDTLKILWRTQNFTYDVVKGDELKLQMTRILEESDVYSIYNNMRVRISWNPQVDLWYVYLINDEDEANRASFCVRRLELHTVGTFDGVKPKYAPEGSPSFIGTIARHSTLLDHESKTLVAHPFAPTKLFVEGDIDSVEFTHGRRVLVDGPKMFYKLS